MRPSSFLSRLLSSLLVSVAALSVTVDPLLAQATSRAPAAAGVPRPFDVHDLVAMDRLSQPAVSPDGRQVAFVVRSTDLEANRGRTDLWLIGIEGGEPRRLTTDPASDHSPIWSADGSALLFVSGRSGSEQLWRLPLGGGEAIRLTDLPLGVANPQLSADGRHLVFTAEVFLDCLTLQCTADRSERQQPHATGVVHDRLFVRHWDVWADGRRSQLFALDLEAPGEEPRRLSRGLDGDVPSKPFGGAEEIALSPDGRWVVFASRVEAEKEAWSTNFDLWAAPIDGSAEPSRLTTNPAWDTHPVFGSDGTLYWLAMERPGYESDRFSLRRARFADGRVEGIERPFADWDRSIGDFRVADDGTVFVVAADLGEQALFALDPARDEVVWRVGDGSVGSPALAGDRVVFLRSDLDSPDDLWSVPRSGGEPRALTRFNEERLDGIAFGAYEQFSFPGWNDETVHGWVVEPAGREPGRRYPVAFLIHGGPQGSFGNDFHYRWNPQTYAGAGYAAVMVDFHGSIGYGQSFTDSIRGDWGGKPLEDLQKGLAAALERYDFLDGERVCALGASYGGYMINWIAGAWPERFRCLVNHDGLFDLRSMYFATEELWFPEWDLGAGQPWWHDPEAFERHNPVRLVEQWRTPMLVIHGALDFRVPETQGLATFTALQRRGIPSRFLWYPDENHWVLKPLNSIQWHDEVEGWLDRWLQEPPADR